MRVQNRVILYNIKNGIISSFWKFMSGALFLLLIYGIMLLNIHSLYSKGTVEGTFSILDLLLYFFHGTLILDLSQLRDVYISDSYIILMIFLAFTIGNYVRNDLDEMGTQVFYRVQNRHIWWLGKVVWSFCVVALYFLFIMVIGIVICILHPNGTFGISVNIQFLQVVGYKIDQIGFETQIFMLLVTAVILPFIIIACTLTMKQMVISFVFSSVLGYLYVIVTMILGVFYCNVFFLSNGWMLRRNHLFLSNGITIENLLLCAVIEWGVCYLVGMLYSKRCDLLGANKISN